MLQLIPLRLCLQQCLFELILIDAIFARKPRTEYGVALAVDHVAVPDLGVITRRVGFFEDGRRWDIIRRLRRRGR